ncbi:MAG: hypothetical protein ACYC3L_01160 [Gemmatimonadaceae bacterium]
MSEQPQEPTVTREELKAWLTGALVVNKLRVQMGGDDTGAYYRAALDTLEDAERWRSVKHNGWEVRTDSQFGELHVRIRDVDGEGVPYTVGASDPNDNHSGPDAYDAAIDTARGAQEGR